jgi:5-methylcytosine-specific restriction endonuclease McrA
LSWFNLHWSEQDREEHTKYVRRGSKDSIKFIDEGLPDPDADEKPYPFIPIMIDGDWDLPITNGLKKQKKIRVPLKKSQRIIVFDILGRQCSNCSNKTTLEIHHIDENPSNNSIDNLLVLCYECHKNIKKRKVSQI